MSALEGLTNAPEVSLAEVDPVEAFVLPDAPVMGHKAFHGLVGKMVRTLEPHTEADPAGVLMALLVGLGIELGPEVGWKVGPSFHPLRLFIVLMGQSAVGRKGTATEAANWLLKQVFHDAPERSATGLASGEGLLWAVRDRVTTFKDGVEVILSEGAKDKRLLVREEEFARVLKAMAREGNTLGAQIRTAWDVGPDGIWQALTRTPYKATGPHIGIVANVTPAELELCLKDIEILNGFGNRFLWASVRRSRSLPFGGEVKAEEYTRCAQTLRGRLEQARADKWVMHWHASTREPWAAVYEVLNTPTPGKNSALLSRGAPYVMRLAGLYAVLDGTNAVMPAHLEAASAVWDFSEDSIKYAFKVGTQDTQLERLRAALKEKGRMTLTEVRDLFKRNLETHRRDAMVKELIAAGLIVVKEEQAKAGKPAQVLEWIGG